MTDGMVACLVIGWLAAVVVDVILVIAGAATHYIVSEYE